jgi:hypothetical protein
MHTYSSRLSDLATRVGGWIASVEPDFELVAVDWLAMLY